MRARRSQLENLGLLTVRLAPGLLVAGHGAQKLFGSFDGPGMEKWTAATESIGSASSQSLGGPGSRVGTRWRTAHRRRRVESSGPDRHGLGHDQCGRQRALG
jgi:hypothetical protein